MPDQSILKGKKLLVVDDEVDLLEVIKEEFPDSNVKTASDFENGLKLINEDVFDLVILDIMGVNGFELLKACVKRQFPASMLTAKAISIENINKAMREGAVSFLPKDELGKLPEIVAEILEAIQQGKTHWEKLFERLGSFFREKLGVSWKELETPPFPGFY